MRLSTTTESAKPLRKDARPTATAAPRCRARCVAILGVAALCAASLGLAGCAPALSHDPLVPGTTTLVDLDGDGAQEQVNVDPTDDSLTISDGAAFYRTRDRWHVVEAVLGDTDGDGLTEVIALLASEKGRHIGLFAFFGGAYRERLVTQAIDPAPSAIEVVPTDGGDMLRLVQPQTEDGDAQLVTLLRWNGFGYTRVDTPPDP